MAKMFRVLGKRGRITIPFEIRQRVGFRHNDVLSFTETADGRTVIVRREKICDDCKSIVKEDELTLLAAEFVKFMTIGEGNDFWHEDVKSLSARTAVLEEEAESPEFQEFPDSIQLLAADESVNTSVIRPLMVGYSEYQDVFTACWEDIRNGGDPVETIDTYTAELNSLLAKYAE